MCQSLVVKGLNPPQRQISFHKAENSYVTFILVICYKSFSTVQVNVERGNNDGSQKETEGQESDDETQHSCLPSTSTPKKHGGVPASHEKVQISPVKSIITSQQTQASQEEFDVDSYLNFLHGDKETPECSQRSAGSSWQDEYTKCDICHTCCRIASHLRRSKDCLAQLKSQPQFPLMDNNLSKQNKLSIDGQPFLVSQ